MASRTLEQNRARPQPVSGSRRVTNQGLKRLFKGSVMEIATRHACAYSNREFPSSERRNANNKDDRAACVLLTYSSAALRSVLPLVGLAPPFRGVSAKRSCAPCEADGNTNSVDEGQKSNIVAFERGEHQDAAISVAVSSRDVLSKEIQPKRRHEGSAFPFLRENLLTYGLFDRAVTFQSIVLTSSPSVYSRTSSNSIP